MNNRSIKAAKGKEIQSLEVVEKYSTANQVVLPIEERIEVYDKYDKPKVTSDLVFLTPEIAVEYLNANPNNRIPSPANVAVLANEMKTGQWMVGTDSVGFDTNKNLNNGQHTCLAVISSGVTGVWVNVMKGIDERYIQKADTGKKRSSADVLYMYGIPANLKNIIASAAKSAMCILQGKAETKIQSTGYITNTQCLAFVLANKEALIESAKFALDKKSPFTDKNTVAFLHFLYSQSNREQFNEFIDFVVAPSTEVNAATDFRKLLIADTNNRIAKFPTIKRKQKLIAYITYANLFLQGKTQKKVNLNGKFPELYEPTAGNLRLIISGWSNEMPKM